MLLSRKALVLALIVGSVIALGLSLGLGLGLKKSQSSDAAGLQGTFDEMALKPECAIGQSFIRLLHRVGVTN